MPKPPTPARGRRPAPVAAKRPPRPVVPATVASVTVKAALPADTLQLLQDARALVMGDRGKPAERFAELLAGTTDTVVLFGGNLNYTAPLKVYGAKRVILIGANLSWNNTGVAFELMPGTCLNLSAVQSSVVGKTAGKRLSLFRMDSTRTQLDVAVDFATKFEVQAAEWASVVETTATVSQLPASFTGGSYKFNAPLAAWASRAKDSELAVKSLNDLAANGLNELQVESLSNMLGEVAFKTGRRARVVVGREAKNSQLLVRGDREAATSFAEPLVEFRTDLEGTYQEVDVVFLLNSLTKAPALKLFKADAAKYAAGKLEAVRIAQVEVGKGRDANDTISMNAQRVLHVEIQTNAGNLDAPTAVEVKAQQASLDLAVTGPVTINADYVERLSLNDDSAGGQNHSVLTDRVDYAYAHSAKGKSTLALKPLRPSAPGTRAFSIGALELDSNMQGDIVGVAGKHVLVNSLHSQEAVNFQGDFVASTLASLNGAVFTVKGGNPPTDKSRIGLAINSGANTIHGTGAPLQNAIGSVNIGTKVGV